MYEFSDVKMKAVLRMQHLAQNAGLPQLHIVELGVPVYVSIGHAELRAEKSGCQ